MTASTSTAADKDNTVVVQANSTKRKTIRAILFDLDGTLLDTESLSCRAVIESFAAIDIAIPEEILATLREGGMLLPWELKRRVLGLRGSGIFACL
jgi:phosphoglycolate phosphatase-like HAD superfamily hydrolase